jgi:hypothetical protein
MNRRLFIEKLYKFIDKLSRDFANLRGNCPPFFTLTPLRVFPVDLKGEKVY